MLLWILIATLVNSLLGLIGVLTFWIKEKILNRILICFVAFSAGTLIGGAFFHLLPESLENLAPLTTFGYAVIGFILFLLIEGYFHWHHCKECKVHPFSYIMLIGDGIHNFIDGLIIAVTFLASISLGIVASLMILLHEAPQELGLFGSLVYAGHNKRKALLYSFLAQITCIFGGIAGYFAASKIVQLSNFLIAFAAGGFLYIAASDLIPEIHKFYKGNIKALLPLTFLFLGLVFMLAIKLTA